MFQVYNKVIQLIYYIYIFFFYIVYICLSQTPNLSVLPHFPFGNHKFVFYVCESISVL